jgi:hypothetical protein
VITTGQAVASLRPGIEWTMNGDDVEGIIWHTPNVTPLTKAEVDAEIVRLEQAAVDEAAAREAAKASAVAKLAALGLSASEVEAIVGGSL